MSPIDLKRPMRKILSLAVMGLGLLATGPLQAEIVTFSESFHNTTFKDAAYTTAVWDTISSDLRLHPLDLNRVGFLNTEGNAYATARTGNYLLVSDGTGGLLSLDVSDATTLIEVDNFATLSQTQSLALSGNWAFLAVGSAGFQTANVSDLEDLQAGGSVDLPGFANGVAAAGTWAYVSQANQGVAVVNATDQLNPIHATTLPTADWTWGVATHGNLLLIADGDAGLTVVDITSPGNPNVLESLDTDGACRGVTADADRAYVADGDAGLLIVDISTPSAPVELGRLALDGTCRNVAARGDSVFVAAGSEGLYLIDVTNPAAPQMVSQWDQDETAVTYHVVAEDTHVWLANGPTGIAALVADPNGLDPDRNEGRSLDISGSGDPILRAKLATNHSDSIRYELSANGGISWYHVLPGDDWHTFEPPGDDLRWRALLHQTGPHPGPVCHSLDITYERQHSYGEIVAVTDVPGDTGGQVRLQWLASRHDESASETPITNYSIYRRYAPGTPEEALRYPPGSWDYLTSIPADGEETYAAVVPTLADSTAADGIAWSVFFVRARTNTTFYDCPPDSGYSVNNLQPSPPRWVHADYTPPGGTQLTWSSATDADFAHYRLYRSLVAGQPPLPANLFAVTTDVTYFDTTAQHWYYHVTIVNQAGLESEPAAEVTPVPNAGLVLDLAPNAPNPFNPATVITFTVPDGGQTTRLEIFDARGYRVRVLVDQPLQGGPQKIVWDGRDNHGRQSASGLYTCRLQYGATVLTRKMSLVR